MTNPVTWTIGGSDSSGGAGIQADLITFNNLGAHGCSVITAITAQNTLGVKSIESVSPAMLQAQIDALLEDLPPQAIKTGMLYSVETIKQIAKLFVQIKAFRICDPVMVATSGNSLLSGKNTTQAFIDHLLPNVDLLTPNIPEAETLLGIKPSTAENHNQTYIIELANKLHTLGAKAVLLKGGHSDGPFSNDYFLNDDHSVWLSSKRINTTSTHGTGCTLSSTIAATIACGYPLIDALVIAKAYVNQGLRTAKGIGKGHGPIAHGNWPEDFFDLPILIPSSTLPALKQDLPAFPNCGKEKLGVYPIVNNSSWLEKLLPLGISTAQLRIKKDNNEKQIEEEIIRSIEIARRYSCRLFINDHWQLAIKHNAYGVHLGQEDLDTANIDELLKSGIRLGISTHSYAEVARALAYKPSYIAIGPIYSTSTKAMHWQPQGLENLKRWRRSLPYPLVAIAGITLERLPAVIEAGADGVAVIKDILNDQDPIAKAKGWLQAYAKVTDKIHCKMSASS
jgi:hydroxymethylpyrimidine kinase / phosphomethylpyrimidine kinase / thiamine-phosphate diphosphorylase